MKVVIALFAVFVLFILALSRGESGTFPRYTDNAMTIQNQMALINEERQDKGLKALLENKKLNDSACEKLEDMVEHSYWAHISPNGTRPWHWFKKVGYSYRYAGENLAYGQDNVKELISSWMESPTHRKNILSKQYKEQGACTSYVDFLGIGEKTWLTVSHFGTQS